MNIALKIIDLWKQDKIDMVFCSYSSTIPLLEEHGVPYYFLYPVKDQLESQIKELLSQIRLEKYRENLPAAIAIAAHEPSISDKTDQILEDAIQNIKKEFLIDAILQESWNTDGSFVMNETNQLIGPLGSSQLPSFPQNLPDNIFKIAENCKLSTLTIQKLTSIIKMTGSYELTTNELADHMGVTVRNANRILRNLENGGAATIAHTRSTTSKGRPVKVYRLKL